MAWAKGKPFPHGEVAYSKLSREEQLAYMREKNRAYYAKKVGGVKRNMNHTPESRAQWARDKSNRRCSRAKEARFDDEFTKFVIREAHDLRKLRNSLLGFEWHVDHVIPLKGRQVSGLHIWSNLAVIPKVENLRKGNKNTIHEKWPKGLQEGSGPLHQQT